MAHGGDLRNALENTRRYLLDQRVAGGHWRGRLATSALSTATATVALSLVDAQRHDALIRGGLDWLARHANEDGGWGDTVRSRSNINTTALCWAALAVAPEPLPRWVRAADAARTWIEQKTGTLEPGRIVETILAFYGRDRTFSTPICTLLALTGRLGPRREAFARIPALPFELAAAPQRMWRLLRLPVVSYALPALVAIGQARHHFAPTRRPLARVLRWLTRRRTLDVVRRMQASTGGFLEAVPLTSFVTACLASIGHREHAITREAERFLLELVRGNGGWPIDTSLETWVTSLSVSALAGGGRLHDLLDAESRERIVHWLLDQQYGYVHPFTNAPPGGWSWLNGDGAVPDADDTPGAMLALHHLASDGSRVRDAAARGATWLLELQNRDGGIPTFCRGWNKLPFDRSAPDITAHTLRAWARWRDAFPEELARRIDRARDAAIAYLRRSQRPDGTWLPLWFGNEWMPGDDNPSYGTARVVKALIELGMVDDAMTQRGVSWLRTAQAGDGSWGCTPDGTGHASIEETALAVEALADHAMHCGGGTETAASTNAVRRGIGWLVNATDDGRRFEPSPIGFYFARLWYFEQLYPVVFALGAFERAATLLGVDARAEAPLAASAR